MPEQAVDESAMTSATPKANDPDFIGSRMRQAAFPSPQAHEFHTRAKMAQPSCLEASRRARFDEATVIRPNIVYRARVPPRLGQDERGAVVSGVFDEAPARRPIVDHGEATQKLYAVWATKYASLVLFEQVHGARTMMTAAATRDAIGAVRIRDTFDGRKGRHGV